MNALFYGAVTLIWGSTWLAISYQVGTVTTAASIFYRSTAAGLLLVAYLWLRGLPMRFSLRQHGLIAITGCTLFSGNYLFLYPAEELVPSGLVAVIFAMTVPFNLINASVLLGDSVERRVLVAGGMGVGGIALVFWPDLVQFQLNAGSLRGAGLALVAAYLFSLGGVVSAKAQLTGVPVLQTEAYGLIYGALFLVPVTLLTGGFEFALRSAYVISLAYLVIFGSIIGFAMYLTVTERLGAARAAYVTVLFPIVALLWSTLLENYRWTALNLAGVALILLGSGLAIARRRSVPLAQRRGGVPVPEGSTPELSCVRGRRPKLGGTD
jgi:drug/metabolite transporter (DMT)-like permease